MNTVSNPSVCSHGPQGCRACFARADLPWHAPEEQEFAVGGHRWRLRANPGYWGAPRPRVLVVGFSKGPDQKAKIDDFVAGAIGFEDIPFNDEDGRMRPHLRDTLATVGLIPAGAPIEPLFEPGERTFGFASFIRCSVTYAAPGKAKFVGAGGAITAKTVQMVPDFVRRCIKSHFDTMPGTVRLVVMLGAGVDYVTACMAAVGGTPVFDDVDVSYAYLAGDKAVIHVPHPSGSASGPVAAFCYREPNPSAAAEKNMPECRRQARLLLREMRRLHGAVWPLPAPRESAAA